MKRIMGILFFLFYSLTFAGGGELPRFEAPLSTSWLSSFSLSYVNYIFWYDLTSLRCTLTVPMDFYDETGKYQITDGSFTYVDETLHYNQPTHQIGTLAATITLTSEPRVIIFSIDPPVDIDFCENFKADLTINYKNINDNSTYSVSTGWRDFSSIIFHKNVPTPTLVYPESNKYINNSILFSWEPSGNQELANATLYDQNNQFVAGNSISGTGESITLSIPQKRGLYDVAWTASLGVRGCESSQYKLATKTVYRAATPDISVNMTSISEILINGVPYFNLKYNVYQQLTHPSVTISNISVAAYKTFDYATNQSTFIFADDATYSGSLTQGQTVELNLYLPISICQSYDIVRVYFTETYLHNQIPSYLNISLPSSGEPDIIVVMPYTEFGN